MRRGSFLTCLTVVLCLSALPALAHPFTFKGTVAAVVPTKVTVNTTDDVTKKPVVKSFDIDKDTKIFRGKAEVTFAQAKIQKGEQISVTVNMDDGGEVYAEEIRLPAGK